MSKWIPVSERLPENEAVLITWDNGDYKSIAEAVYWSGRWHWWSSTIVDTFHEYGKCEYDLIDPAIQVLAWMPLPEPYGVGEKDGG